jgi:hypothetical protein
MKIMATQTVMFLCASAVLVVVLRTLLHTRAVVIALLLGAAVAISWWIFRLLEQAVLWMWQWSGAAAEFVIQRVPSRSTSRRGIGPDESI